MNLNKHNVKTRLSRITIINETSTIVFNDWLSIRFQHRKAFLLAWLVCRAITEETKFQSLGGIPPSELLRLCQVEGLRMNRNTLNTLWHDEVEFRRHHELALRLFEVTYLKDGIEPPRITPSFIASILQLIFGKVRATDSEELHGNIKLFTVRADPEQIFVYRTSEEALASGIQPSGLSEITKFRKHQSEVGFIFWRHKVKIDDNGSSDSVVTIKLFNLSPVPLLQHMLPLWSDTPQQASNMGVKAWLKNGTELSVEILVGKTGKKKKVEFLMVFPKPIYLGQTVEFSFSYHAEKVYSEGKGYFTWYFDHPHTEYIVELEFSNSWLIQNPIVFKDDKDEDLFQVKQLATNRIIWKRFFPATGSHYQIYFHLRRASGKSSNS